MSPYLRGKLLGLSLLVGLGAIGVVAAGGLSGSEMAVWIGVIAACLLVALAVLGGRRA